MTWPVATGGDAPAEATQTSAVEGRRRKAHMSMVVYVEVALAFILAMALIGFLVLTVR